MGGEADGGSVSRLGGTVYSAEHTRSRVYGLSFPHVTGLHVHLIILQPSLSPLSAIVVSIYPSQPIPSVQPI